MAHNAAEALLLRGPPVVQLNVGGVLFQTSRETLLKHDAAGLRALLVSEDGAPRFDCSGHLFVDSNPRTFEVVLDFLRDGTAALPFTQFELQKLYIDARKFQVYALEAQVLGALRHFEPAAQAYPLSREQEARPAQRLQAVYGAHGSGGSAQHQQQQQQHQGLVLSPAASVQPPGMPPPPVVGSPHVAAAPAATAGAAAASTAPPQEQASSYEASALTVAPAKRKRAFERAKKPYFERAKKRWEQEEQFLLPVPLPDGSTHWPLVEEGEPDSEDRGRVYCRLCRHFGGSAPAHCNQFASEEGYTGGKKSSLVQHQTRNREHLVHCQQLLQQAGKAPRQEQQGPQPLQQQPVPMVVRTPQHGPRPAASPLQSPAVPPAQRPAPGIPAPPFLTPAMATAFAAAARSGAFAPRPAVPGAAVPRPAAPAAVPALAFPGHQGSLGSLTDVSSAAATPAAAPADAATAAADALSAPDVQLFSGAGPLSPRSATGPAAGGGLAAAGRAGSLLADAESPATLGASGSATRPMVLVQSLANSLASGAGGMLPWVGESLTPAATPAAKQRPARPAEATPTPQGQTAQQAQQQVAMVSPPVLRQGSAHEPRPQQEPASLAHYPQQAQQHPVARVPQNLQQGSPQLPGARPGLAAQQPAAHAAVAQQLLRQHSGQPLGRQQGAAQQAGLRGLPRALSFPCDPPQCQQPPAAPLQTLRRQQLQPSPQQPGQQLPPQQRAQQPQQAQQPPASLAPSHPLSRASLSKCLDLLFASAAGSTGSHQVHHPSAAPPSPAQPSPAHPAMSQPSPARPLPHQQLPAHSGPAQPATFHAPVLTPLQQQAQQAAQRMPPAQQQAAAASQALLAPGAAPPAPPPLPAACQPPGRLAPPHSTVPLPGIQQPAAVLPPPPPSSSSRLAMGEDQPHFVDTLLANHSGEMEDACAAAMQEAAAAAAVLGGQQGSGLPHSPQPSLLHSPQPSLHRQPSQQQQQQFAPLPPPPAHLPPWQLPGGSPCERAPQGSAAGSALPSPTHPATAVPEPPPPAVQPSSSGSMGGCEPGPASTSLLTLPPPAADGPLHGSASANDMLALDESILQSPTAALLCSFLDGSSPPASALRHAPDAAPPAVVAAACGCAGGRGGGSDGGSGSAAHTPAPGLPDLAGVELPYALCALPDGDADPLEGPLSLPAIPHLALVPMEGSGSTPALLDRTLSSDLPPLGPGLGGAEAAAAAAAAGAAAAAQGADAGAATDEEEQQRDTELLKLIHQSSIGASLPLLADLDLVLPDAEVV